MIIIVILLLLVPREVGRVGLDVSDLPAFVAFPHMWLGVPRGSPASTPSSSSPCGCDGLFHASELDGESGELLVDGAGVVCARRSGKGDGTGLGLELHGGQLCFKVELTSESELLELPVGGGY